MENTISKNEKPVEELPTRDEFLLEALENYLIEQKSYYLDRHSQFLPELKKRLEKLTHRQRLVIKLYFWEGLTVNEISAKLKIKQNTVSERLATALAILRADSKSLAKVAGRSDPPFSRASKAKTDKKAS